MKTTGQELYRWYAQEYELLNTEVDAWEFLEQNEQTVWNALADRLGERIFRLTGQPLPEEVAALRVIGPAGKDIGSYEDVFGGFVLEKDETVLQALARSLPPHGFYLRS